MGYIKRKTPHGERVVKIADDELQRMKDDGTAVAIKGTGGKLFAEVEAAPGPTPKQRSAEPPQDKPASEKTGGEYETTQMKPKAQK